MIQRSIRTGFRVINNFAAVRQKSAFSFPTKLNVVDPLEYEQVEPDKDDEIVIAMSSGVDSSVTASLYAKSYKNVRGVYMANWSQSAKCLEDDWNDVKRVCGQLKIPCERVNFEREYWTDVFEPMINMYKNGLTPNPDVGCNKYVKFGKMIEHLHNKFENVDKKWWLVTGHYARIMRHRESGKYHLLRGLYPNKDQSYYLSMLPPDTLSRVLMPIGHMTKPDVREIAAKENLITASKPDSQGLCFVSQDNKKFGSFLDEYIRPNPGNYVTEDGKIWGTHNGLWHATIGQRANICMPQGDPKYKGVWFVSEKRTDTNELVIVKGGNNAALYASKLRVRDWQWLETNFDTSKFCTDNLTIQYRSLQNSPDAVASFESLGNDEVEIHLKESARAMAPGQNIVLYNGNRVLGCGVLQITN
ncbi:mitochondrial tRNA-specific 2-thiouridylase 1 [[Candida] anglica]|uniref:tRNA-5-taurinomethyluridine 2-sulfurtransferase n=1 Tax=[Candida] anglica TaxID=148631 RepID=A0ABP0EM59_9ASCO